MNKWAVAVATLFLTAASAVQGITLTDYTQIIADQKEVWIPYQSCDGANFSNTDGCILTQDYLATHNALSPFPETNMPWPAPAFATGSSGFCYDHYRGPAFAFSTTAFPQNTYISWPNDTARVSYFFNETAELLVEFVSPPVLTLRTPQFFNVSGTSHLDLLTQPATSLCRRIAKEYITATLNICNQVCHGLENEVAIDLAMKSLANVLFDPLQCYNDPDANVSLTGPTTGLLGILHDFNTGAVDLENGECNLKYGPPVCGTIPSNASLCDAQTDAPCFGDYCNGGCTMPASMWKSAKKKPLDWADFCPQAWMSSVPNFSNTLQTTPYYNAPEFTWGQIMDAKDYDETCIIAAKQHIAAQFNKECFAACSTETVDSVMTELDALLNANCLTLATGNKKGYINGFGDVNTTSRRYALLLSDYLKSYNTGRYVGPGTCELQDSLVLASITSTSAATCDSESNSYHLSKAMALTGFWFTVIACSVITLVGILYIGYLIMQCVNDQRAGESGEMRPPVGGSGTDSEAQMFSASASSNFAHPHNPFGALTQRHVR